MFKGESRRFYIRLEQLSSFEKLVEESGLEVKEEIDSLTHSKSLIYYIRTRDFSRLDELCVQEGIEILEDNVPFTHQNWQLQNLPTWLRVLVIVGIILFLYFFIFNNQISFSW